MSDINKYGKKIKEIEFSLIDNDEYKDFKNFIIYERGLLIEKSFFLWHDVIYVTYHNKDKKIIINLNDQRELKIYSKEKSELMSFYNKASKQVEKYRHFDTLKKLKVDLDEINIVMDTNSFDDEAYLDTLTGDIIYIPMELNEDNVYDEDYIKDLPKWEQEEAEHIKKVYEDPDDRYIIIPKRYPSDSYEIMLNFIKEIEDEKIADKLFDAINGRGAFKRFKNLVRKYKGLEDRWYEYKERYEIEEVKNWLYSIGIDPV